MLAIKLEVTNSRNDDSRVEWHLAKTEEEINSWEAEKKKEETKWNRHTPGAVSTRYYYFERYDAKTLMTQQLSNLAGLTLYQLGLILGAFE